MTRIEKLEQIQKSALTKIEQAGFKGLAMLCPGTGKTFLAFKAIYRMLELGLIKKGDKVYFLAETNARKITVFEDEAPKFKDIYGLDLVEDFNIIFACYQGIPVEKYNRFEDAGIVIYDEIHDTLTEKYYVNLTRSLCRYSLGLTGAMSMDVSVFPNRLPEEFKDRVFQPQSATNAKQVTDQCTKGQMLEMFCPVLLVYPTSQAIQDGVIAPYKTFILDHELSNRLKYKNIYKNSAVVNEYDYYMAKKKASEDDMQKRVVRMYAARGMAEALYALPSKVNVAKALLKRLEGQKTILFGERLDILSKITDNVATSTTTAELVKKFNNGDINIIASSKMLKQGITLEGVENVIFVSYGSKWHNFEQKRARVRFLKGAQAKLFFFVTKDTYEERWIKQIVIEKDGKGKTIKVHDLNIEAHVKTQKLVQWYEKNRVLLP